MPTRLETRWRLGPVGGPTSRILAALMLGPLISLAGDRKMGLQMG